jgi:Putative Flp pilus-assembly TadE/G-like
MGRNTVPTAYRSTNATHANWSAARRGQVLLIVAIALVALIGAVALAVDIGFMWGARRRMQTAADGAAVAGAVASRQSQNVTTAADDTASLNGFTNGANNVTVTVNSSYSGGGCSANCVQVIIDQPQSTYFLRALGVSSIDVKASAVAGTTNSGGCIYGLGPTSPSLTVVGTPTINSACEILVNTDAHCGGNLTVTAPIGVSGSTHNCPNVSTISETPDPFAYLGCSSSSCMPSCSGHTSQNITNGQTVTLSPGSYCGGITIHNGATVTFSSGTYNLGSGGLSATGGTITGTGVTFISTGAISLNGTGTVTLSAPTSNTYVGSADVAGILFWDTSTSNSTIAGGSGSTFDGSLYFPQSQLTYTGTSSSGCGTSSCSTGNTAGCGYTIIAADSVKFSGTTSLCDDYSSLPNGESPILATALYQ